MKIENSKLKIMQEPEFYHKDIFGQVIDFTADEKDESESLPLDKKGREFNPFVFTDAVGSKKKKDAWILYQKALLSGVSAEEMFFKLVWQVKSMLLAKKTKSALEADMKEFPYSKAKGFLKNFKEGELEKLSSNLVTGYQEARRGQGEIETFLEKAILSL